MEKTMWDYWSNRWGSLEETAEHYVYQKSVFGFPVWYATHSRQQMFKTHDAALKAQIEYMGQPVSEQWVKNMNAKLYSEG